MRTVVHLSDLHFGSIDPAASAILAEAVQAADPDLVVISGDLTQRARPREFLQARAFLQTLPMPQLVVPGNHDVPLYNLFRRFRDPLRRYRRHIGADVEPVHADGAMTVVGINTARSLAFKGGRINGAQLARAARVFAAEPPQAVRIVVTHHPFDNDTPDEDGGIVGRARLAMAAFAHAGVDVVLSGHLHVSRFAGSAGRYGARGYSALLVQAGTATSSRRREELNAFNVLRIEAKRIAVDCMTLSAREGFVAGSSQIFVKSGRSWEPVYARSGGALPFAGG